MQSTVITRVIGTALFASLAMPAQQPQQRGSKFPPSYKIIDLGTLPGGTFSQATAINNSGLVTGISTAADGTQHAVIWERGRIKDLGIPGLGGPNSGAFAVNERGQADLQAESSTLDPHNENFCAYGTGFTCLPALWRHGVLTLLPTLGGYNGTVGTINNRGEVAGIAEQNILDLDCPSGAAVNGTGPQLFDFQAVIWGPRKGEIRQLPPLSGDSVGIALSINDNGQAVGVSGSCANTTLPPFTDGPHAVLWEKDGSVHDLGTLGGTVDPALLAIGNVAFSINNAGQVTGASALPGNTNIRAFVWTRERGMQNLGTLPGDVNSVGLAINNRGEVVGASVDGTPAAGTPNVFIWRDGVMSELNKLTQPDSPFVHLLNPGALNDAGEIPGFGITSAGDVHAFLAIPRDGNATDAEHRTDDEENAAIPDEHTKRPDDILSEDAHRRLHQRLGHH
jgi:probable HAF family extracellular repeat protein